MASITAALSSKFELFIKLGSLVCDYPHYLALSYVAGSSIKRRIEDGRGNNQLRTWPSG